MGARLVVSGRYNVSAFGCRACPGLMGLSGGIGH